MAAPAQCAHTAPKRHAHTGHPRRDSHGTWPRGDGGRDVSRTTAREVAGSRQRDDGRRRRDRLDCGQRSRSEAFRMSRPPPGRRADYRWFHAITTRWMDNDVFQHVNNVNYFSYFDTAVTYYEMTEQVVGLLDGPTHCVVAEVACRYHSSLAFPDRVTVGIAWRRSDAVRCATRSVYSATMTIWRRPRATSSMCSSSAARSGRCRSPMRRARSWRASRRDARSAAGRLCQALSRGTTAMPPAARRMTTETKGDA